MSDKIDPLTCLCEGNFECPTPDVCPEMFRRENDALRAENKQLKAQHANDLHTIDVGSKANAALEIENENVRAALEKWRPIIERASDWYVRQGDIPRAKAFTAMLGDFDAVLANTKRA